MHFPLSDLEDLIRAAGDAVLDVYHSSFAVTTKEDRTPLTLADQRSHALLVKGLERIAPDIPVVSEEGAHIPYEERRHWRRFWLVDPLDGTKEFIRRNGEFTINVALIDNGRPVLGLVLVPDQNRLFIGDVHDGCLEKRGQDTRHVVIKDPGMVEPLVVVATRSHPTPQMEAFFRHLPAHKRLPRGSALKFCAVAAGEAHCYARFGPTWEWDTAAGHAVVEAAGGVVVDPRGQPLRYNKPDLLNGYFLAGPSRAWMQAVGVLSAASKALAE
ncbi:3'(2'),5'-bisphosphate nucleotidase CysQ [Desulfosoma caldarium]|uniref:3'(2'),5'-bisphosphate nucleotidase CysQ n=1 Tax=Desulfosoma caldarium TaxID=610254 RepID=A0A3N1UQZ3_9BACT|nr:3'(2'),5'-bisphosphate nucleotidase CysQ [Desulfosoma caldarium]ROQ93532.1 3'(2'),5'-bisphosphate nucleotidase [Desulfosoma caldarium]